jgi:hypothetical protein
MVCLTVALDKCGSNEGRNRSGRTIIQGNFLLRINCMDVGLFNVLQIASFIFTNWLEMGQPPVIQGSYRLYVVLKPQKE